MAFRSLCEAIKNPNRFDGYFPSFIIFAAYIRERKLLEEIDTYTVEDWQDLYRSLAMQPDIQKHLFTICWEIACEPSYPGDGVVAVAILCSPKKEVVSLAA